MKKVFIGVLAALMLFAFTACESQGYKVPTGLTATTTKTSYVIGSDVDVSSITGTLEYSDGSTRTIPGSDLLINASFDLEGSKQIEVSYASVSGNLSVQIPVTVYGVSAIESLAVEFPASLAVATAKTVTVPAVATLANGDTDNVDVIITYTVTGKVGDSVSPSSVSFAVNNSTNPVDNTVVTGSGDWKVTVAAEAGKFDANNVTDLVVVYKNTTTASAGVDSPYVDDVISYEIYEVDGNGNRNTTALSTGYTVLNNETLPAGGKYTTTKDASKVWTVVYDKDPRISAEISFKAGRGFISNVTAEAISPAPSITEGQTMTPSMLSTYYTIKTTYTGPEGGSISLNDQNCVITNPTVTENTYTPVVKVLYGKAGSEEWKALSLTALTVTNID